MSIAVDAYERHLKTRGLRPGSITTIRFRLRALLGFVARDRALASLTPPVARRLAAARAAVTKTDTQVGELSAARGFCTWCVDQGWLRVDPFAELEPTGARARGKPQLRIEEARTFLRAALAERSQAGLAAATALLMGLRASEVVDRVVRDVDDGARVLWVGAAKTAAGIRHLEVPEVLRRRLAALVAGRGGGERLFGDVDRHWLGYHVRRIAAAAGVPAVSPHGLRGTHASIGVEAMPVDHVARTLGQDGPQVTRRHYLAAGAERRGRAKVALRVLDGGLAPRAGNARTRSRSPSSPTSRKRSATG